VGQIVVEAGTHLDIVADDDEAVEGKAARVCRRPSAAMRRPRRRMDDIVADPQADKHGELAMFRGQLIHVWNPPAYRCPSEKIIPYYPLMDNLSMEGREVDDGLV